MTEKRRKFRRRPVLIIVTLLLVAVLGLVIGKMIVDSNRANEEKVETKESLSDVVLDNGKKSGGESSSSKVETGGQEVEEDPTGKKPKQYEGENPNKSESLTGYISSKAVNDGKLVLRVVINQMVNNEGTCTATLKAENGKEVKKTAKTMAGPSTGSCQGFDIPVSELGSGKWKIEINVDANGKSGIIGGEVQL